MSVTTATHYVLTCDVCGKAYRYYNTDTDTREILRWVDDPTVPDWATDNLLRDGWIVTTTTLCPEERDWVEAAFDRIVVAATTDPLF